MYLCSSASRHGRKRRLVAERAGERDRVHAIVRRVVRRNERGGSGEVESELEIFDRHGKLLDTVYILAPPVSQMVFNTTKNDN